MALPSYHEANLAVSDPQAQFHSLTITKHISLLPKYIGKLRTGIKECLEKEKKLYSSELDGVLIAYSNIQRLSSGGLVFEELSCLHFDIQIDVIVFRPTVGCTLKGMVNKISGNHLGCLVHNCFNASILKPRDEDINDWTGSKLSLGEEFTFVVVKVVSQNGVLFLRGKIPQDISSDQENSNAHHQMCPLDELVSAQPELKRQEIRKEKTDKKSKSKKRKISEIEDEHRGPEPSKKKHKHNRHNDQVGFSSPDNRHSPQKHLQSTPSNSKMSTDYITEQANDLLATLSKTPKHLKKSKTDECVPFNSSPSDVLPSVGSDSGVSSILSSAELDVSHDDLSLSKKKKNKKDKYHKDKTSVSIDSSVVSSPVTEKRKKHKKSRKSEAYENSSFVETESITPRKHKHKKKM